MMKLQKRYSRRQIAEAIKHWQNVLKQLDESKSPLLDAFAEEFGADVVFSNQPFEMNDAIANRMFKILNDTLFDSKIPIVPVKYMSYDDICRYDCQFYNKYKEPKDDEYVNPPITIYGMHSAIVLNKTFKYDEPLMFAKEEFIYLNSSKIKNTSFALNTASLCHEMIHAYDRFFGEYQDRYKAKFISNSELKIHDTPTFERKMKEANDNYIKVVKMIPKKQTVNQSNDNAIELALKALKESENGMSCIIEDNTPEIQFVGNRKYIMIHDFD